MDMWAYLPMVSLLIHAIVGNTEVDDTTLSSKIDLGNASDNFSNDNHTEKPSVDIWKMSKRVSLRKERNKREMNPNITPIDEINPDKIVSKRRETVGPWYLPIRKEGFETVSQERTSPWRWWQDEKRNIDKPTISCVCELHGKYHHDLDSGYGKRETPYTTNLELKRTKMSDDRENILNDFDGIKRKELQKAAFRFNKWGGKRADISDRKRVLLFLRNPDVRILNVMGDGLPTERAARIKDRILTMYGRRNIGFDNETSDDERVNEINDWSTMPAKKGGHVPYKKTRFDPWGGKRSDHNWNDYIECMLKTINRDLNS